MRAAIVGKFYYRRRTPIVGNPLERTPLSPFDGFFMFNLW